MNRRFLLTWLLLPLPILVTAFGVLTGGAVLSRATGDSAGAVLMGRVAGGCVVLLVIDVVLLVGVLATLALVDAEGRENGRGPGP